MNNQPDLTTQIENLVRDHLAQIRQQVAVALERAFTTVDVATKAPASERRSRKRRAPGVRRDSEAVAALAERLHEAVCNSPGEAMTVFAEQLGVSARELHLPMTKLKQAGRLRSVGERSQTRYFPGLAVRSGGE